MRPTKYEYFLNMAKLVSSRGTCLRRKVGCVLINARGHVLATGYNGVASGERHCNHEEPNPLNLKPDYPFACEGSQSPSGQNLDACKAIHAEQNALLQCRDAWDIEICFVTTSPCITCVKLLMNTSCGMIVFGEPYAHEGAKDLWTKKPGRAWLWYGHDS